MLKHIKSIAIFGGATSPEESQECKDAYLVSKFLAEKGITIVSGGGPGVMRASIEGAIAVSGKVHAVNFTPKHAEGLEARFHHSYPQVAEHIANYCIREQKIFEAGDAFVFFKGGTGTLSEFFLGWVLNTLYSDRGKPLILYGEFWSKFVDSLKNSMTIRPGQLDKLQLVTLPEEVWEVLEKEDKRFGTLSKLDTVNEEEKNLFWNI